jgi:hypothetical protein
MLEWLCELAVSSSARRFRFGTGRPGLEASVSILADEEGSSSAGAVTASGPSRCRSSSGGRFRMTPSLHAHTAATGPRM